MVSTHYQTQLRKKLDKYFSLEGLNTLCFDLGLDYDNLPGSTKESRSRELVKWAVKMEKLDELISHSEQQLPGVNWNFEANVFICYKRSEEIDRQLAEFLHQKLSDFNNQVFIDTTSRDDQAWMNKIDNKIKQADFVILLLSRNVSFSEMVQAQIQQAHQYSQRRDHPQIILVRVDYPNLPPYSIDTYLNSQPAIIWQSRKDDDRVAGEVQAILSGRSYVAHPEAPFATKPLELTLSEDGRIVTSPGTIQSPFHVALSEPLPEFDPRILEQNPNIVSELIAPGGTVRLRDKFYIEREADTWVKRNITRPGSFTTIRASRQTGKSSLMVRGIQHAKEINARSILLDMQRIDEQQLGSLDIFLFYLANYIANKLHLDSENVEEIWRSQLGAPDKLTNFVEQYVLTMPETPIVLAIDEADRLLDTDFYAQFFGLLRSWYNAAAYEDQWELLRVILIISTEPDSLITEVNQSPFNVGLKLYLEDFNRGELGELNNRHGTPVRSDEFERFKRLLNGHPYLSRQALYTLVTQKMTWTQFEEVATSDTGPFGEHLRNLQWLLRNNKKLRIGLKQVIKNNYCDDDMVRYQLLQAGLIKGVGESYYCRCDLYQQYFQDKL